VLADRDLASAEATIGPPVETLATLALGE